MLKLLKYPYVSPFRFRKEQPPDYPYVVLIWLINIITYYYNKYYKKTARILAVFLISLFNFCLPILLYVPLKLQIQLKVMLKLLKYPYVSPFRFRKEQPPDYPYVVLIWLINIITYYYNKYYKKTARILAVFLISLFNFCLPILLYVPLKHHQYCLIYLPSPVYFLNLYQIHNMNNCLYSYLSYVLYLRPQIH